MAGGRAVRQKRKHSRRNMRKAKRPGGETGQEGGGGEEKKRGKSSGGTRGRGKELVYEGGGKIGEISEGGGTAAWREERKERENEKGKEGEMQHGKEE